MKAQVGHHYSKERLIFFLVAIVLVAMTIVLVLRRTAQPTFSPPQLSTYSFPAWGMDGNNEWLASPGYLIENTSFYEPMVEMEDWMMQLEGWESNTTSPSETNFFAEAPFTEVQPWMLSPMEWLNPGYLEEMIIPEPWMTQLEVWDSYSVAPAEEWISVEEWMLDLSAWNPLNSLGLAQESIEEEWIPLEPWMLNDQAWSPMGFAQVETGIAVQFVEEEVEVKAWMLNLDEWNLPLHGDSSLPSDISRE